MKIFKITAILSSIGIFLLAAILPASAQPASSSPVYVFQNVNIIPMDEERILANQTVIIRDGRIAEMGSSGDINLPEGAVKIDGSGKYLMPGLAEMHGHIPPPNLPGSYPESYTEDILFLYLTGGITTVRGMLGHEGQLELEEKVENGEILGPSLYLAGPSFNGNSISSPEQAAERVKKQKKEGWYLLKVHPGLSREEYDAMATTAQELHIPFGGHVPEDVGLMHALEMKQQTFDHLDGYIRYLEAEEKPMNPQKLEQAVQQTKRAGAWMVPTMALWETLIGAADYEAMKQYPELKYMPEVVLKQWNASIEEFQSRAEVNITAAREHARNRIDLLKALHQADVLILMGTDSPQIYSVPGFSIHRELKLMKKAGMNNFEILQTGTINVGNYFSDQDDFGTVAPGQRADLLLLNGNPLEDLGHLENHAGMMVRGRWISREMMDQKLQSIISN